MFVSIIPRIYWLSISDCRISPVISKISGQHHTQSCQHNIQHINAAVASAKIIPQLNHIYAHRTAKTHKGNPKAYHLTSLFLPGNFLYEIYRQIIHYRFCTAKNS